MRNRNHSHSSLARNCVQCGTEYGTGLRLWGHVVPVEGTVTYHCLHLAAPGAELRKQAALPGRAGDCTQLLPQSHCVVSFDCMLHGCCRLLQAQYRKRTCRQQNSLRLNTSLRLTNVLWVNHLIMRIRHIHSQNKLNCILSMNWGGGCKDMLRNEAGWQQGGAKLRPTPLHTARTARAAANVMSH